MSRKLFLLHLPANALLLWLAYEWLGVDESSGGRLLLSAADALVILALACWLHGATMVYFRARKDARINDALRISLRHLGVLLLLAIASVALYTAVGRLPIRSVSWALRWIVLPAVLLPIASGLAEMGWRGWRAIASRRPWRNWIAIPALAITVSWVPFAILGWKPHASGFGLEMISFVARGLLAYLLMVTSAIGMARAAAPR